MVSGVVYVNMAVPWSVWDIINPRAPGPYPQVRWLDPPRTHPWPTFETEVGQEP